MTKILYIGNNLKQPSTNVSAIGILGPLLQSSGFKLYYSSSKANKLLRLFDMLFSIIKNVYQVDIVLIDTYSTANFYYALFTSQLCRVLHIKYIPILHGGNLIRRLQSNPVISGMIFNHAHKLISPSLYQKEVFESFDYQKIHYIPNSFKINFYHFSTKEFKRPKLLWVRSFSNIYNPQLAIRVLKTLIDKGMNASLCMVGPDGDGSLKEVKQLVSDLNVSVRFTGKLTKAKWRTLAKDYNIFINTTNFDNMPVSVIEAMALGLPVISTNVGGMPHLIQDGIDGFLVPQNDINAFANAIKDIVNNPEISNAMALKARQKVEQFDWEVVKHKWFRVLN